MLVKLTNNAPAVRTMLIAFDNIEDAAGAVSDTIAAGIVPAALEIMDQPMVAAVENFVHADLPVDAGAVLLAEVTGHQVAVDAEADIVVGIARERGATQVRVAQDDAERALLWKARKAAFGAVAQAAPDYYLHDTVVPRIHLVETMRKIYEIGDRYDLAMLNVFHAGDGNLHPLVAFDSRDPEMLARVTAAANEMVMVSLEVGGSLSGEHGIGLEKRDLMDQVFGPVDLDAQARLREAFDPAGKMNPDKVLPAWISLLRLRSDHRSRRGSMSRIGVDVEMLLDAAACSPRAGEPDVLHWVAPHSIEQAAEIMRAATDTAQGVLIWGGGTHQGHGYRVEASIALSTHRLAEVVEWVPDDLTVVVEAGVKVADLEATLGERGQTAVLPETPGDATVGGTIAAGVSGWRRLRYGPTRDRVLETVMATGDGRVVRSGGRLVKNVTGYDLPRLAAGSYGSLGVIGQVCLKLWPRGARFAGVPVEDVAAARRGIFRPLSIVETESGMMAYFAGTPEEIDAQAEAIGGLPVEDPRWPEVARQSVAHDGPRACGGWLLKR